MDILVRDNTPYKDVTISANGITIELGLFDKDETKNLIATLLEAVHDLSR